MRAYQQKITIIKKKLDLTYTIQTHPKDELNTTMEHIKKKFVHQKKKKVVPHPLMKNLSEKLH